MNDLNKQLKDILYITSCIIDEDNNRNYGNRDIYITKLKNHWGYFIEMDNNSNDPILLAQKGLITVNSHKNSQCGITDLNQANKDLQEKNSKLEDVKKLLLKEVYIKSDAASYNKILLDIANILN